MKWYFWNCGWWYILLQRMTYSVNFKWKLLSFPKKLNNTLTCSFEILKLLVSCYIGFCIDAKHFYVNTLFFSTWERSLVASFHWSVLLHHKHFQLFSSYLWMLSSSQIDKIKSRFFFSFTCLFIMKQRMKFWQMPTCGSRHDVGNNDVNLRRK